MHINMTREALIERLEDRIKAAVADDQRELKKHAVDEQKALMAFRKRLQSAMKWDYAAVKKSGFSVGLGYDHRPSCPKAESDKIKRVLASVKLDTRKGSFSLSPSSDLHDAVNWMPRGERAKSDMC